MTRFLPCTTLALLMVTQLHLLVPPSAGAQPEEELPAGYLPLIEEALQEFDRANFAEARALFERAHRLYPNARALRGIGMAAFEMRDHLGAYLASGEALEHPVRPLSGAPPRSSALAP